MDISAREHRYQQLQQQWQTGQLSEPAFVAAVDDLGFVDENGRAWMLGTQSGQWYVYNGQRWQPGNPRAVTRPQPSAPVSQTISWLSMSTLMAWLAVPARAMVIVGFTMLVIFALVWPVDSDSLQRGPQAAPSPRPPLGSSGGGGGGGGGSGSGGSGGGGGGNGGGGTGSAAVVKQSSIVGTVTDASTDQPGTGIEVSVGGMIVRTDTDGSYSITGLPAGSYTVGVIVPGQGLAPQDTYYVNLDGQSQVSVDLTYNSEGRPLPTDTPQPASVAAPLPAQATPPPALPDSGAPVAPRPLVFLGAGLLLVLVGGFILGGRRLNG